METTKGSGPVKIKEAPAAAATFTIEVSCKLADGQSSSVFEGDEVELLAQLIKSEPLRTDAPKKVLDDAELAAYRFTWSAAQGDKIGNVVVRNAKRPWEATF